MENLDWSTPIGKSAFESIACMVAALECDYDRMEELKQKVEDERENLDEFRKLEASALALTDDERDELRELVDAAGECESRENAEERIHEDALSVEVRSDWVAIGDTMEAAEYCILLTTGGPAVRIVGDLDRGEPSSARLQVQDWGKPWTEYIPADRDTLMSYVSCFCFQS